MEPYSLLVISRTQSIAKRLRSALGAGECLIRWVRSTGQALDFDPDPDLLLMDQPPSGGARNATRLKRRFDAPLLLLSRAGLGIPEDVDATLPRSAETERVVDLIEATLIERSPHRVRAAGMSLDREMGRLQMAGEVYQLRPTGSQILAELMAEAGKVVPREELFRRVWQTEDGDNTRALDVHISHLRKEIEPDPRNPVLIVTERGVGYRLEPPA